VALVLPEVSTAAMQAMLDELAAAVTPGTHAVVILDRAGWHTANELTIPANLTPVFLPPYSPELNAIERVWLYLRLLRRLDQAPRRTRPHPLALLLRLAPHGQNLTGLV
jgi:transposase